MKNILLKILVIILKIIYLPLRILKVKNKVTYMSRESNTETLDFKYIRERLEKEYPEYKNVVLTKKLEAKDGVIKQLLPNCINIIKQMYNLATSKIVIVDTYCIPVSVLPHKKETKVIQIWHALGAIKKFGYQTLDLRYGSNLKMAKIMHMHENYDYVLAPSKTTAKLYEEAFNVDESKIIYLGMPRVDYILEQNEEIKEKIYETYPILKQKENIVYVPTYRKGDKLELDELVERIDTNKYNLLIKLHPLDTHEYKKGKEGVIYDNKFTTYDIIKISDRIITDYSALSIESSILDKPIYFYTYDIEKYQIDNGLNFEFDKEPIGKYNSKNADELLRMLNEEYDYSVLEKFKNKYVSINKKDCTGQIVKFIVRLMKNEKVEDLGNEPSKEESLV